MTTPVTVPMTAWEQIAVVCVFTLLIAGMGWLAFRAFSSAINDVNKAFTQAVADINNHYVLILETNNLQWQKYFDARSESSKLVNDSIIKQLTSLTAAIEKMDTNFTIHDIMERQALADMADKRRSPRAK